MKGKLVCKNWPKDRPNKHKLSLAMSWVLMEIHVEQGRSDRTEYYDKRVRMALVRRGLIVCKPLACPPNYFEFSLTVAGQEEANWLCSRDAENIAWERARKGDSPAGAVKAKGVKK